MRTVDFHTHVFPDAIAERAVERVTNGYVLQPSFDGRLVSWQAKMDAVGIDTAVILPVATKPTQVVTINNWVSGIANERIVGFGAMHPDFPEPAAEIARIRQLGMIGMKFQPNWQDARPDDPRMFPIYEAAEDMIVVIHGGREVGELSEILATPAAVARVHKLFPRLRIVVAHMGGMEMWDEVEESLMGEDVWFDTACCTPDLLPDERFLDMVRAHGVERILFGSDAPCGKPGAQIERIKALPLTDTEKARILGENACELLGVTASLW